MFHLSDPTHGIRTIKFVHLNSRKMSFVVKVIGMKGLEMGRISVFMVGRLSIGGRVQGLAHPFVKFDFDGGILALEGLN
jgi:hypothetical protein